MSRLIWMFVFLLLWGGMNQEAHAWFWDDDVLVTINGSKYTEQDYRDWWRSWQEENMAVPDSTAEFINWQLLAQEGLRLQLDTEPSFRRKVETFVKVRSLMMLKNEEVDAKAKPTPEQLWAMYEEQYCPRWRIAVFFFATEEQAQAQAAALQQGEISTEELRELGHGEGGPLFYEAKWLRVPQITEEWFAALKGRQPGHITTPQPKGNYFIILHFMAEKGPDKEDFASVKKTIAAKVKDRLSGERTAALVEKLKKKYQVEVDEEFLAEIDETPLEMERAEKAVITTNAGEISAGAVQAMMAKERQFRKQYKFAAEDPDRLKERVVANMLAQTLISWEAMDRHYEKRPPFAAVYDFYRKHRLTKEIEKRYIKPQATVDEAEARAYYDAHQDEFSHPEMVSYILVEAEENLVKRMRREIAEGADFFKVVGKHFPGGLPVQQMPVNHLDPGLSSPLLALSKGEVSMPFTMNNNSAMVRLVNRRAAMPLPFPQVKDEIVKKLGDEKFTAARREFLDLLKERSAITVNKKVWNRLQKELTKQHEPTDTH